MLKRVTEGMVKERVFEAPFEVGPEGESGIFPAEMIASMKDDQTGKGLACLRNDRRPVWLEHGNGESNATLEGQTGSRPSGPYRPPGENVKVDHLHTLTSCNTHAHTHTHTFYKTALLKYH